MDVKSKEAEDAGGIVSLEFPLEFRRGRVRPDASTFHARVRQSRRSRCAGSLCPGVMDVLSAYRGENFTIAPGRHSFLSRVCAGAVVFTFASVKPTR